MQSGEAQRLLDALLGVDAPVGFAIFDESHRYVAVNAVLARHHGKSVSHHLGRRVEDVGSHAAAGNHAAELIDQILRTGEQIEEDEPPAGAADRPVLLHSSWYPLLGEAGQVTAVAVFVVDDTTLRQTDLALRDSRAQTGRLLEVAEALAKVVTVAEVVAAVTSIGRDTVGADRSDVAVTGPDGLGLLPGDNERSGRKWPGEAATPTAQVVRTGWPLFIGSREELARLFADEGLLSHADAMGERSWAILPLVGSSGRLGALRFAYAAPRHFDEQDRRFLRAVAQQCAVALERAELFEQERTATASLTLGLLPSRLPGIAGLELGARTVTGSPDHTVGGDWYDVFALPGGAVSLAVGDVMGHGLPVATGMGQLRTALRALALTDPDPGVVLTGLDRLVEGGGPVEMATVVYAVLDPADGTVRFGDAGHLPLAHLPEQGSPELVDAGVGTTPIGVPEPRYGRTVSLKHGDIVLGFTDGLVESRGRSIEDGLAALLTCLDAARDQTLEELLDTVMAEMHDPQGIDDVTILGLRWTRT
jgi:serine phosphatase RsbU (regulator of sigma subunit)